MVSASVRPCLGLALAPSSAVVSQRAALCTTPLAVRHSRQCMLRKPHMQAVQASAEESEGNNQALSAGRRSALLSLSAGVLLPFLTTPTADARDIKTVLVLGATGGTGKRVVAQLSQRGLDVRAGTRNVEKAVAGGLGGAGVQVVLADVLDSRTLREAMRGVDAVIITTGYSGSLLNPGGFKKIDQEGTINAINAAKEAGVSKLVLMTSLLTNARAVGQENNSNFKFLNLFGGVLDAKLVAEKTLKASGLSWTIVRPGGLTNNSAIAVGNLVIRGEDTLFGLPEDPGREISRDTVAAVLVEAALQPAADSRVFEIVASIKADEIPPAEWFN